MFFRTFSIRIFLIALLGVCLGNFFIGEIGDAIGIGNPHVFAADATPITQDPAVKSSGTEVSLVALIDNLIKLLSLTVTPMIAFAGWLLSPDWTYGDLFGMRELLYRLWVLSSNIAYFGYALLLVGSAIFTMFYPGSGHKYQLGALLPRLAIGILFVPFTYWIVSAILSLANLLTATVISLPGDIMQNGDFTIMKQQSWYTDKIIPKVVISDFSSETNQAQTSSTAQMANQTPACKGTDDANCLSVQDFMENNLSRGPYSVLIGFSYAAFRMHDYKVINNGLIQSLTSIGKVGIITVFAAVTYVAFAILVFALCFLLVQRAFYMWAYIAFSPFMTFYYVLTGKQEDKNNMNIKSFLGLALVPVYVGAAFAFGFVFISLMKSVALSTTPNETQCTIETGDAKYGTIQGRQIVGGMGCIGTKQGTSEAGKDQVTVSGFQLGGISFVTVGNFVSEGDLASADQNQLGIIGTVLTSFLGLMVLWVGVRMAFKSSTITEKLMKPLEGMLGTVQGLPKYMPIPGIGSIGALGEANRVLSSKTQTALEKKAQKQWNDAMGGHIFSIPEQLSNDDSQALSRLTERPLKNSEELKRAQGAIKNSWESNGSNELFRKHGAKIKGILDQNTDDAQLLQLANQTGVTNLTEQNIHDLRGVADWSNPDNAQKRTLLALLGVDTANQDRYMNATNNPVIQTQTNTSTTIPIKNKQIQVNFSETDNEKIANDIVQKLKDVGLTTATEQNLGSLMKAAITTLPSTATLTDTRKTEIGDKVAQKLSQNP